MGEPKRFLLRLPPALFDELRRWSEQEMRSINGQIEWVLRDAVQRRTGRSLDGTPPPDDDSAQPTDGK